MDKIQLVMASQSEHKVGEIKSMLDPKYQLITMSEAGFEEDIVEDGVTLEENAWIKARTLNNVLHTNIFGEDTGLEVEALDGLPGVNTARFAGNERSDDKNIAKLLALLEDGTNRKARFRTIIALIYDEKEFTFEGIVNGTIALQKSGSHGFGYDPIFIPDGYDETFAVLPAEIKNKISHRAMAVQQMVELLNRL
jgi:XTP/dITP diphosphohydrolase